MHENPPFEVPVRLVCGDSGENVATDECRDAVDAAVEADMLAAGQGEDGFVGMG